MKSNVQFPLDKGVDVFKTHGHVRVPGAKGVESRPITILIQTGKRFLAGFGCHSGVSEPLLLWKPAGRRWTWLERTSFGVGYARKAGRVPLEQGLKLVAGYALRRRGGYAGHCCGSLVMPGRSRTADREGQRLAGVTGWREGMAGGPPGPPVSERWIHSREVAPQIRCWAWQVPYQTPESNATRSGDFLLEGDRTHSAAGAGARLSSWLLGCSTRLRSDHHAAVRFPAQLVWCRLSRLPVSFCRAPPFKPLGRGSPSQPRPGIKDSWVAAKRKQFPCGNAGL